MVRAWRDWGGGVTIRNVTFSGGVRLSSLNPVLLQTRRGNFRGLLDKKKLHVAVLKSLKV